MLPAMCAHLLMLLCAVLLLPLLSLPLLRWLLFCFCPCVLPSICLSQGIEDCIFVQCLKDVVASGMASCDRVFGRIAHTPGVRCGPSSHQVQLRPGPCRLRHMQRTRIRRVSGGWE